MTPEERFARIEANLDRVTALLIETADRQSTHEFQFAQHKEEADARSRKIDAQLAEISRDLAIDAENIRRLANIAGAPDQQRTYIGEI